MSREYDGTAANQLAVTIVDAVAAATGRDPLELEPLANVIDPDALESLRARRGSSADGDDTRIEFTYAGRRVAVTSDGDVAVDREPVSARSVSTAAEFHAALARLVVEAASNGVDVEGGWSSRNGTDSPEWDVEIVEVRRPEGFARSD